MAGHISQADIMSHAVILRLKAQLREKERQLRQAEKEIDRLEGLSGSRYSDIQMIVTAFTAMAMGAGLSLGILAMVGW